MEQLEIGTREIPKPQKRLWVATLGVIFVQMLVYYHCMVTAQGRSNAEVADVLLPITERWKQMIAPFGESGEQLMHENQLPSLDLSNDKWVGSGWFDLLFTPSDDGSYVRKTSEMIHDMQRILLHIAFPAFFIVLGYKMAFLLRRIYGRNYNPADGGGARPITLGGVVRKKLRLKAMTLVVSYTITVLLLSLMVFFLVSDVPTQVHISSENIKQTTPTENSLKNDDPLQQSINTNRYSQPQGLMVRHAVGDFIIFGSQPLVYASRQEEKIKEKTFYSSALTTVFDKVERLVTIERVPIDWTRYVFLRGPDYLLFCGYLVLLWFIFLPYCYTLFHFSRSNARPAKTKVVFNSSKVVVVVLAMVICPLLWLYIWLTWQQATFVLLVISIWYYYYHRYQRQRNPTLHTPNIFSGGVSTSQEAGLLTGSGNGTAIFSEMRVALHLCSQMEHWWMIGGAALVPTVMLVWADQYFASTQMNTGIVLIFVAPILLTIVPLPPVFTIYIPLSPIALWTLIVKGRQYSNPDNDRFNVKSHYYPHEQLNSQKANRLNNNHTQQYNDSLWTVWYINMGLMRPIIVFLGYVLLMAHHEILEPTQLPSPTSLFGMIEISQKNSNLIAQFFFSFVFHSSYFIIGFIIQLFMGQMPTLPFKGQPNNLLACATAMVTVLCFMPVAGPLQHFVTFAGGFASYVGQIQRVLSILSSAFWIFIMLTFVKEMGNLPIIYAAEQFIYDARHIVFYVHPIFTHLIGFLMNGGWVPTLSWTRKVYFLYFLVLVLSHLAAYLYLRGIPLKKRVSQPNDLMLRLSL
jgi:hypothetical protein